MQPYPQQDNKRPARVVSDICDLLHDDTAATQVRALRWITHVLNDASLYRRWWFLENVSTTTLHANQDVIDLKGQVGAVAGLFIGKRLWVLPLEAVVQLRQDAQIFNRPNGGTPTHYALEAGFRVHLWPCPEKDYPFALLYSRPMSLEIVPDVWETIVLNGVLGLFGRHFDRDALTQDPVEFERRYRAALRQAAREHDDVLVFERFHRERRAATGTTPISSTDSAISFVQPASMTGIGHVTIEIGNYPLVVA